MNPPTLTRQIRESSGAAVTTARGMGGDALPAILPLLADSDPDIRLTAAECLEAVIPADPASESAGKVQDAAIKLMVDDDDQIASTGANILLKCPPKDANAKLAMAFGRASVEYVKVQAPIIAGVHGTEHDRIAWQGFLATETDPDISGGLHTGLARMGVEESRAWFLSTLLQSKLLASELWIDRAVYMLDTWVVPTLVKMLEREDAAYTVSPDDSPKVIRVKDLAAWAVLTILKPPTDNPDRRVPQPVAKRSYTPEEMNQVRAIAKAAEAK